MALAAALPATTAHAQDSASAVAAPEPARLAAAQALIAKVMPAEQRDAMIERMMRPTMDNMRAELMDSPMFKEMTGKNPKAGEMINAFVDGELERSITLTKAAMPSMLDAMARAYARRFTLDDLKAVSAFFDTPAGRAFAVGAPTIMPDPDVLAAQRTMMTQAMAGVQARAAALGERIVEATKETK